MTTADLYQNIKEAYSNSNLNKISVTLIGLYREQQYGTLKQIAEIISESDAFEPGTDAKNFARMMMLYHPDRGDFHRNEIDRLAAAKDHDGLLKYSHILRLGKIDEIAATLATYEDIDYSPVYEWDINLENFTIINTGGNVVEEKTRRVVSKKRFYSFYEGVQMRIFGDLNVGFPTYYLEDLDEFELSQSGINDLDGIQYCLHAIVIDLSENAISDITPLWKLTQLEELNLSDNEIEDIETLSNLTNLKSLNLSNNSIRDISYLLELPKLEYVNLTGTKVNQSQVEELEEAGVTVVL
jgi:Leucine-rich repeat (LRR) protein